MKFKAGLYWTVGTKIKLANVQHRPQPSIKIHQNLSSNFGDEICGPIFSSCVHLMHFLQRTRMKWYITKAGYIIVIPIKNAGTFYYFSHYIENEISLPNDN
jgi:hypothetical protein